MKNKLLNKFSLLLVAMLMAIGVILTGFSVQQINASAASTSSTKTVFSGAGSSNDDTLYNATNTYNYKGDNLSFDRSYLYFDTSVENGNVVSKDAPQITVLTHGLNGDASHWSNNDSSGKFAYDKDSLFARLNDELLKDGGKGANIYWAKMKNATSFYLYDLNNSNNINSNGEYLENVSMSSITDISKHIFIIFEATHNAADSYNYEVYEEFNYMLSKIVFDVKQLNMGELPRINLVGHSRGGITNLMYALDHPKMVASMFSMGTPYFGSDTAATDLGASIAHYALGLDDITSRNIYTEYFNRWNLSYESLYSEIDAYALGGYSDSDFLFDALINSSSSVVEDEISDGALTAIKWAIKSCPVTVRSLNESAEIIDFIVSLFRDEDYNESEFESYVQIIADIQYFVKDENKNWWDNFWDNVAHNIRFIGCPYFMNDLLVDLPSQTGIDKHSDTYRSYGFNVYTKCFRDDDYNGVTKKLSSPNDPAIVHNLEARDTDFINYILSRISLGTSSNKFLYNQTSETTATLTAYSGNSLLLTGKIELPAEIDGLSVDGIGYDLFKGDGESITSLSIPTTVKYIETEAFAGLKSLSEVEFASNCSLTTIGARAFAGCTELQSFRITDNVKIIAHDAFLNCNNLTTLTVDAGNTLYSVIDGVLFNKAGTELVYYPSGKNATSYIIPENVTEIGAYAFSSNPNLEQVYINGTPNIRDYAFFNCANLEEVYFSSYTVPSIATGAFNENDFTLYVPHSVQNKYIMEFSGYTSNIASISIKVTFVSDGKIINSLNTYYGATIVGLTNPSKKGYNFNGWFDNVEYSGDNYQDIGLWDSLVDLTVYAKWTARQFYITYSGEESENLKDKLVTYDEPIGDLPELSKTGYTFAGWEDEHNEPYNKNTIWQRTSNLTLYSKFNVNEYTIFYNGNGGYTSSTSQNVKYESVVNSLATASQVGYTFTGWNTQADGKGDFISAPYKYIIAKDLTVYAQYLVNKYSATFDKQGGIGGSDGVEVTYNSSMPSGVTAPTRTGYTFQGYFYIENGVKTYYYTADMTSTATWKFTKQTTLYADWTANKYTVTLDKQSGNGGTSSIVATYNSPMPTNVTAPTREGYTFQGYYSGKNQTGTKYYNANMTNANSWDNAANTKIYAAWSANEYTVILEKQSGEGGSDSVKATYGYSMPSATAPYRIGYTFLGYYSEPNGGGTQYYYANMSSANEWDMASDETLYAYWQGNQYTVYFNMQGGSGGTTSTTVTYGSPMPTAGLSAPKRNGYNFIGYFSEIGGRGTKYYDGPNMESVHDWDNLKDGITLYAYWEKVIYVVTMHFTGTWGEGTYTAEVSYGDEMPIINQGFAPKRDGYKFVGYFSQPSGIGKQYYSSKIISRQYLDMDQYYESLVPVATWDKYGNGDIYAHWELIECDYEYNNIRQGQGYLSTSTVHLVHGEKVTIKAKPISDNKFLYFERDGVKYYESPVEWDIELMLSEGKGIYVPKKEFFAVYQEDESCLAAGSLITLADGRQVAVENLTGNEMLLVWNLYTGTYDIAPILFIDTDPLQFYNVINLSFSDGTTVKVISEHGFWDYDLNKYVYLDEQADKYIGHWFNKNGRKVQLVGVETKEEYTTAWSPVTSGHFCYFVNGMLSMPGGIDGLFNIFDVDPETMKYDEAAMQVDIEEYGLFTYEEFIKYFNMSEESFEAINGQYLKVALGKGIITMDYLIRLYNRYADLL